MRVQSPARQSQHKVSLSSRFLTASPARGAESLVAFDRASVRKAPETSAADLAIIITYIAPVRPSSLSFLPYVACFRMPPSLSDGALLPVLTPPATPLDLISPHQRLPILSEAIAAPFWLAPPSLDPSSILGRWVKENWPATHANTTTPKTPKMPA